MNWHTKHRNPWRAVSVPSQQVLPCLTSAPCTGLSGNEKAAQRYLREALTLFPAEGASNVMHKMSCLSSLARAQSKMNKFADAVRLQEEALELSTTQFGNKHVKTLTIMADLARFYLDVQRYDDAQKLINTSMDLAEKHLPPDSIILARICHIAGNTCVRLHEWADAIKHFERSASINREIKWEHGPPNWIQSRELALAKGHLGDWKGAAEAIDRDRRITSTVSPAHCRTCPKVTS